MRPTATVLLAGSPSCTEALASALAPLSLRLERAVTPQEAAGRAAGHDLVIAVFEPGLATLFAHAPEVPLLVVEAPPSRLVELIAEGATDALPAPLDAPLFAAKVEALLRLRRAAQRDAQEIRTRAEAAQRDAEDATRLRDQFLATISHEMRTPLTSILGWVRLLQLGKASAEPGGHALESIERHARVEAQMVADLLDVQRIASGKMSLAFRDVEVGTLMEEAVAALRPAAEEAGVQVRLALPVDEELRVFGDAERLREVFQSLLSNATKFSPRGNQVDVQIQPSGLEVLVLVRDHGRGIHPDFLPHAFDPFRQQDSRLSRDKGGLGLGLALVRHVVEMHGGSVVAESDGAGTGARFTVTLPLRSRTSRPSVPPPPRVQPSPQLGAQDLQGLRVLLVEDDSDTRYLICTMLEQFGAHVVQAESAAEALRLLPLERCDLLLSDISMPGEDGYSLIRRVRDAAQSTIPAAALTANARGEDRARALAAGFNEHIAKPVDPSELTRILARLVARKA